MSVYISRILPTTRLGRTLFGRKRKHTSPKSSKQKLNLRPGDWVEVKPFDVIFATLNSEGKLRGLAFTKEMMQYCGRRFKVYKKLERIVLESTGELRRIRAPTVLLEGVVCDGEAHGNCDRSCFCFWREAWLKPILPNSQEDKDNLQEGKQG